jgi:hypothetical protein
VHTHYNLDQIEEILEERAERTQLHITQNTRIRKLLTYLLTELSPSWEATNCAATQELPSILWNPKVHHRFLMNFRNRLIFLRWGVVSPTPNPQAGGPPLVGCPRLLIQYIRSYPPYLEAVSYIRNVRTRHAVVTRDPHTHESENYDEKFIKEKWKLQIIRILQPQTMHRNICFSYKPINTTWHYNTTLQIDFIFLSTETVKNEHFGDSTGLL